METKDFIEELGISVDENDFDVNGDKYTLYLADSDEFANLYSLLSKSDLLDVDADNTSMSEDSSKITYMADDFDVKLEADYGADIYKLEVNKAE